MFLQEQHVSNRTMGPSSGRHSNDIENGSAIGLRQMFMYCHFQFHYYANLMMAP
jgi:hypothetical protein